MKEQKSDKIRVGNHSARSNKNGVFPAEHPDRNFDLSHAPHIDPDKVKENKTVMFLSTEEQRKNGITFDEYEGYIYEALFSAQLAVQNAKQINYRHKDRIKTMDQFRRKRNYCPEEDLITLGNHDNSVTGEELWSLFQEYCRWHIEKFPKCILLDAALHMDEPDAAPHIHLRKVWLASAKEQAEHELEVYHQNREEYKRKKHPEIPEEDYPIVHQQALLRQMGIKRPDPESPEGQYNNAKQTYSAKCRQKLIQLAEERNIPLEIKPKPSDEVGLELMQYKLTKAEQKLKDAEEANAEMQKQLSVTQHQIRDLEQQLYEKSDEFAELIYAMENPMPVPPKKPVKKFLESEADYEKRIAADEKYQAELADYRIRLEQMPSVVSVRKKAKELEEMRKKLQDEIDREVQKQTQTFFDRRLLEFVKELQKVKMPDSEESIYSYYKQMTLEDKQTLPEHLYSVTKEAPDYQEEISHNDREDYDYSER